MLSLLKDCKITRVSADGAGAASATPTKGTIIDMLGWKSVMFVAALGDVVSGSAVSLKAAGGPADDTAQMTLITGASAGGTAGASDYDDKLLLLDLLSPTDRYIEAQIFHVTQNAPFDGIFAIQYNGSHRPATQGSTVVATDLVP